MALEIKHDGKIYVFEPTHITTCNCIDKLDDYLCFGLYDNSTFSTVFMTPNDKATKTSNNDFYKEFIDTELSLHTKIFKDKNNHNIKCVSTEWTNNRFNALIKNAFDNDLIDFALNNFDVIYKLKPNRHNLKSHKIMTGLESARRDLEIKRIFTKHYIMMILTFLSLEATGKALDPNPKESVYKGGFYTLKIITPKPNKTEKSNKPDKPTEKQLTIDDVINKNEIKRNSQSKELVLAFFKKYLSQENIIPNAQTLWTYAISEDIKIQGVPVKANKQKGIKQAYLSYGGKEYDKNTFEKTYARMPFKNKK